MHQKRQFVLQIYWERNHLSLPPKYAIFRKPGVGKSHWRLQIRNKRPVGFVAQFLHVSNLNSYSPIVRNSYVNSWSNQSKGWSEIAFVRDWWLKNRFISAQICNRIMISLWTMMKRKWIYKIISSFQLNLTCIEQPESQFSNQMHDLACDLFT